MSNSFNPRSMLAIGIAMRAHFCNVTTDEIAVAAFDKLHQIARDDVDADPSACGLPVWGPLAEHSADTVFDNVEDLVQRILAVLPEPKEAPVVIVTVGGSNVQSVEVQGEADVFVLDFDSGRESPKGEHPEIPGYDGARASIWNAGGVDTAKPEFVARILVLAERQPSAALAEVIERFGDKQWSLIDGPETGRGIEYWYQDQAETTQIYLCVEEGQVVSCEEYELEDA